MAALASLALETKDDALVEPGVSFVEMDCFVERGDGREENSDVDGDGDVAQAKNVPNLDEPGDFGRGLLISRWC